MKPHHVLVYNVTHSDLVLSIKSQGLSHDGLLFARPKFSSVESVGRWVADGLDPASLLTTEDEKNDKYFVGFKMKSQLFVPWSSIHLKGSLPIPPGSSAGAQTEVDAVFVPLAAQLIPSWKKRIEVASVNHIFIVCGAGKPSDKSSSMNGNSTRPSADLIVQFLEVSRVVDEHTSVEIVDSSGYDLFDYDENVSFVRESLMPKLEAIRRLVSVNDQGSWRPFMDVTVSLTEGSSARLGALGAALRSYRPWYAHLCQLKTFWHERRLLSTDLRFHSFERVETTPPLVVTELSEEFQLVVRELVTYRDEFQRAAIARTSELQSFWLRKSFRPILCVLLVHSDGSNPKFYRGINLEVSQPTGSLCSERNAIGSALSDSPRLNRRDVKLVAVLALNLISTSASRQSSPATKRSRSESINNGFELGEGSEINPRGPCGACTEWLRKISEVNPDFKVMTFRDASCRECFVREVE